MEDSKLELDDSLERTYIGVCPKHNWEGFRRKNYDEADKDLSGHKELFPDESHTGAKVIEE